jgi:hypothetical protein
VPDVFPPDPAHALDREPRRRAPHHRGGPHPPGLDQPGDSLLIDAEHPVTRARVTAAPGTTLRFICVIHPWMQGKLKVT